MIKGRFIVNCAIMQFLKFAGCGAVATFAQYLILIVLVKTLFLNPITASTIGFIIGALINYFLNYYLTFHSKKPHSITVIKFIVTALVGVILNTSILTLSITGLHFYYLWAQLIATFFVLFWNFTFNTFWTFKQNVIN
jgi:putative flippase GtrA